MTRAIDLLRSEPRARVFFLALTQSSLGNGAAYVALLVIAYDRLESAWAIGLVLFADLVPSMLLGPVFGAAADRWERRTCMIVADVVRAGAFLGIALVDGFAATVVLAMFAGAGTALFTPAALAALPSLVKPERLAAATALFGAVADLGFTAGPAIAAGLFLVAGPETILIANAVTFAISGFALLFIGFGRRAEVGEAGAQPGLFGAAREGIGAVLQMAGIRAVIAGSGAMLLAAGLFNVAELPFVTGDLDGGDASFALLTALYGVGFVGGSLSGSKGGEPLDLKRWWLIGLAVVSLGFVACGAAPGVAAATFAFTLAGVGNGLILVYERLLIQKTVPDRLTGRVFGVKDGLTAWAFAAAFLGAGPLVELMGARAVIVIAGGAGVLVWLGSRLALRGAWVVPQAAEAGAAAGLGRGARAFRRAAGEDRPDALRAGEGGDALLDHTH